MFKNQLKIAFRNLIKSQAQSLINIAGLSIGICAAIIIYFIVSFDLGFDSYHDDSDRIYRLVQHEFMNGEIDYDPGIPYPLRLEFQNEYPEVEALAFVDQNGGSLINVMKDGKKIKYENEGIGVAFTMPSLFEIFKYEFLLGDPNSLSEPNHVILSKQVAERYFGDYKDALGKVVNYENSVDLTVTGIINNPPENTDIFHQIFISFETGGEQRLWNSWTSTSSSVQAFVKVAPSTNMDQFRDKIISYIQDRKEDGNATKKELHLQPIEEMHHDARYGNFSWRVASYSEINTLVIIGMLLLMAACVNFVNLNTAMAVKRSKEIGIRKVMGSQRKTIIAQYLGETAMITILAIGVSLGLAEFAQLYLEALLGYKTPYFHYDLQLTVFLTILFVTVTLFSGLYPALVISGYQPIQALKNNVTQRGSNVGILRKALIVFQLLVGQVLVVAVIVVIQQLDHFLTQPNGFNSEAIVQFHVPRPREVDLGLLTERIQQIENVEAVTMSSTGTASDNQWGATVRFTNNNEELVSDFKVKLIDEHFLGTFEIPLIEGMNVKDDTLRKYLLNETALLEMGLSTPSEAIGKKLSAWGTEGEVIGVVKDFKTISLHKEQQPVVLWRDPNMFFLGSVKLSGGNHAATMKKIEKEWVQLFPEFTFSYQYLDDSIELFYENEKRMAQTLSLFAGVAIFIGAIGLLGLISYLLNQKQKEIGIRKVLGATLSQIIYLVSSHFIKLVIVAFLIAAPLSWYAMNMWLEGFAERIAVGLDVFFLAFIFSILLTIITIVYKSIKAALLNPAVVLKDE